MKVQKNFRLNESTCEQLAAMAADLNVSQADVLDEAIHAFTCFYDAMIKTGIKGKENVTRAVYMGSYAVDYAEIARQMDFLK